MTFADYDDADEIAIERAVAGDGISLRNSPASSNSRLYDN